MDALESTVQQVLQKDRIGTPVSVRWIVAGPDLGDVQVLARMLATSENWLGARVSRIHARGHLARGPVTVSAVFEHGQTALLIYGKHGARSDLMLLGNRGAVYHEEEIFLPHLSKGSVDERVSELAALVETAVASAQALQVGDGGNES